jgi:hypothetical protein
MSAIFIDLDNFRMWLSFIYLLRSRLFSTIYCTHFRLRIHKREIDDYWAVDTDSSQCFPNDNLNDSNTRLLFSSKEIIRCKDQKRLEQCYEQSWHSSFFKYIFYRKPMVFLQQTIMAHTSINNGIPYVHIVSFCWGNKLRHFLVLPFYFCFKKQATLFKIKWSKCQKK